MNFRGVWRKMLSSTGQFQRGLEKNTLIDKNFRGVRRKMFSSTGISEGSGEKCSHPQEFQRGMEKNALIHRNFRGVWRKMLSSTGVSEGSKIKLIQEGLQYKSLHLQGGGVCAYKMEWPKTGTSGKTCNSSP